MTHVFRPPLVGDQRLLVPAYFRPTRDRWRDTCREIKRRMLDAVLVMNPNSGPDIAVPADAQLYRDALVSCRGRGLACVGYVSTDYGRRRSTDVRADIDTYVSSFPGLSGFFFDEMSNDQRLRAHYQALYAYVKERSGTARVIGNAGIATSTPWHLVTPVVADVLVVFEGPYALADDDDPNVVTAFSGWSPPAWVFGFPSQALAHLVYESPDDATTGSICRTSQRGNGGWVFVTTDRRPNPWDTVPSAALLNSPTLFRRQELAPPD